MHALGRHARTALACLLPALAMPAAAQDNAAHPLVGTVWTGAGDPATMADVEDAARSAGFVLVGEIHPNAGHHRTQARIVEAIAEAGRRPAVVLEMVPQSLQPALDAFNTAEDPDPEALGPSLDWEARGWPDWTAYRTIAEVAAQYDLPLIAGDLDREAMRAGPGEGAVAYPPDVEERLRAEIAAAHCGLLPEEAIPAMVGVQQARDLSMAGEMLAAGTGGAVLIAGGGHARTDWGVPFVLGALAPEREVVAIGQMEVLPDLETFAGYVEDGEDALPYDYVLFTERSETKDHCAELEEQLKN